MKIDQLQFFTHVKKESFLIFYHSIIIEILVTYYFLCIIILSIFWKYWQKIDIIDFSLEAKKEYGSFAALFSFANDTSMIVLLFWWFRFD